MYSNMIIIHRPIGPGCQVNILGNGDLKSTVSHKQPVVFACRFLKLFFLQLTDCLPWIPVVSCSCIIHSVFCAWRNRWSIHRKWIWSTLNLIKCFFVLFNHFPVPTIQSFKPLSSCDFTGNWIVVLQSHSAYECDTGGRGCSVQLMRGCGKGLIGVTVHTCVPGWAAHQITRHK